MEIDFEHQVWALKQAFTISRGTKTHADVVCVRVRHDGATGRGECVPYARYGESIASVMDQLSQLANDRSVTLAGAPDLDRLQTLLPAGAARNALDCAMWDWRAKHTRQPVWQLAGLETAPTGLTTAYTLSLDSPSAMGEQAYAERRRPLLKIKLGAEDAEDCVAAIKQAAPDAKLIVDANEAWPENDLAELMSAMAALGVSLIEQPLVAQNDGRLAEVSRPVPVAADESCHTSRDLDELKGRYDVVNIKLDKTGGLSEALRTKKMAKTRGFGIMVGCMVSSSLSMAPAILLAQGAEFVDLDGPLLLAEDHAGGLHYDADSHVSPPSAGFWG